MAVRQLDLRRLKALKLAGKPPGNTGGRSYKEIADARDRKRAKAQIRAELRDLERLLRGFKR
jgi:hypothetical protein